MDTPYGKEELLKGDNNARVKIVLPYLDSGVNGQNLATEGHPL